MNARQTPRKRGVRLSDLDREKVYRIGYTGKRWEVLGEDLGGARAAGADGDEASAEGAPPAAYVPRHASPPAAFPDVLNAVGPALADSL